MWGLVGTSRPLWTNWQVSQPHRKLRKQEELSIAIWSKATGESQPQPPTNQFLIRAKSRVTTERPTSITEPRPSKPTTYATEQTSSNAALSASKNMHGSQAVPAEVGSSAAQIMEETAMVSVLAQDSTSSADECNEDREWKPKRRVKTEPSGTGDFMAARHARSLLWENGLAISKESSPRTKGRERYRLLRTDGHVVKISQAVSRFYERDVLKWARERGTAVQREMHDVLGDTAARFHGSPRIPTAVYLIAQGYEPNQFISPMRQKPWPMIYRDLGLYVESSVARMAHVLSAGMEGGYVIGTDDWMKMKQGHKAAQEKTGVDKRSSSKAVEPVDADETITTNRAAVVLASASQVRAAQVLVYLHGIGKTQSVYVSARDTIGATIRAAYPHIELAHHAIYWVRHDSPERPIDEEASVPAEGAIVCRPRLRGGAPPGDGAASSGPAPRREKLDGRIFSLLMMLDDLKTLRGDERTNTCLAAVRQLMAIETRITAGEKATQALLHDLFEACKQPEISRELESAEADIRVAEDLADGVDPAEKSVRFEETSGLRAEILERCAKWHVREIADIVADYKNPDKDVDCLRRVKAAAKRHELDVFLINRGHAWRPHDGPAAARMSVAAVHVEEIPSPAVPNEAGGSAKPKSSRDANKTIAELLAPTPATENSSKPCPYGRGCRDPESCGFESSSHNKINDKAMRMCRKGQHCPHKAQCQYSHCRDDIADAFRELGVKQEECFDFSRTGECAHPGCNRSHKKAKDAGKASTIVRRTGAAGGDGPPDPPSDPEEPDVDDGDVPNMEDGSVAGLAHGEVSECINAHSGSIGQRSSKTLDVSWKMYDVPMGYDVMSIEMENWATEGALYRGKWKTVQLPSTIVDELVSHGHKVGDDKIELLALKCGTLLSMVSITAAQSATAQMYAPVVAHIRLATERHQVKQVLNDNFVWTRMWGVVAIIVFLCCLGGSIHAAPPAPEFAVTDWATVRVGPILDIGATARWWGVDAYLPRALFRARDVNLIETQSYYDSWRAARRMGPVGVAVFGVAAMDGHNPVRALMDGQYLARDAARAKACHGTIEMTAFAGTGTLDDDIDLGPCKRHTVGTLIRDVAFALAAAAAAGWMTYRGRAWGAVRAVAESTGVALIGATCGFPGHALGAIESVKATGAHWTSTLILLLAFGLEAGFEHVGVVDTAGIMPFVLVTAITLVLTYSLCGQADTRRILFHTLSHSALSTLPLSLAIAIHLVVNAAGRWQLDAARMYSPEIDEPLAGSIGKLYHEGYRVYHTDTLDLEVKEIKKHAKMVCPKEPWRKQRKSKPRVVQAGFAVRGYEPVVYESNFVNERTAVAKRVVSATPKVDKVLMAEFIAWVKSNAKWLFPHCHHIEPLDFETYLAGSNSSPSVKAQNRKARADDDANGVSDDTKFSKKELYDRTKRESFVKVECNNYRTTEGTAAKASRLIQGATAAFVSRVGPWFAAAQARVKRYWNGRKVPILFTSGRSAAECAAYITSCPDDWAIIEDDISAYDSSICEELCKLEWWLAKQWGAPQAVLDLMWANIQTHGRTSTGIKYKVRGTRKSGDPYTSLFNSIINGLMKLFLYARYTGATAEEIKRDVRMLVQGDDNLMRHAGKALDFSADMLKLGFESVCIVRDGLGTAEFCSQRLTLTGKGWRFVPKAGRVLAKMCTFINPPCSSGAGLARGVALGFLAGASHCPPLRAVCNRILKLTEGNKAIVDRTAKDWQMKHNIEEPDRLGFLSFCLQYDWSDHAQTEFEKHLETLSLGDVTDHWTFVSLCDRDTSGPKAIFGTHKPRRARARRMNVLKVALVAIVALAAMCAPSFVDSCKATVSRGDLANVDGVSPRNQFLYESGTESRLQPVYVGAAEQTDMLNTITDPRREEACKITWTVPGRPTAAQVSLSIPLPPERASGVSVEMSSNKKHNNNNKQHKKSASTKKAVKTIKSAMKKAVAIKGRGDYRPSSMTRVKGRGDYFSDLLGGIGHGVGNLVGGGIGKLFGSGDYIKDGPRTNSLWKHRQPSTGQIDASFAAGSNPSMAPFTMGAMSVQFDEGPPRITHREFIGPVVSDGTQKFSTKIYRIQPGLKGRDVLFPWGSSVAACFQQYELLGMVLEYRTTSSNFAADSALGSVMLSTLYDANASPLATQSAVDNNDYTTSSVPSASVYHPIECATKESPTVVRYVRTGNAALENDERLDDVGVFQVSQFGITAPAGSQLGELWATYDIKFMKAALPDLHVGTTWAAGGVAVDTASFNSDCLVNFTVNENSSLPVEIGASVGPGKLALPVGYNGAFALIFTSSCSGAADLSKDVVTSGPDMLSYGTDVTLLGLLPFGDQLEQVAVANSYIPPQTAPSVAGGPVAATYVLLFSTIAENIDQNWIVLKPTWVSSTTVPYGLGSSVLISAMDSDLVTSQYGLERELLKLSRNAKVRDLLVKTVRPRTRRPSLADEYDFGVTPGARASAAAAAVVQRDHFQGHPGVKSPLGR